MKLGDFGVSKRVRPAANTSWHTSIEADCSAPEVLGLLGSDDTEESSYADPVDMWSLGYLAHWLLTKRYPVSKFALPRYCRQMAPIPLSELAKEGVTNLAADFVENLLHLAPADRMTAEEAYRHPWLALPCRRSTPSPERAPSPECTPFSERTPSQKFTHFHFQPANKAKDYSGTRRLAQGSSTTEPLSQIQSGLAPSSDDEDSEYVKISNRPVQLILRSKKIST